MITRLLSFALVVLLSAVPAGAAGLLFRNVRVFDGARVIEKTDVLVRDGRIARVGRGIAAPKGAEVVDAAGKTLLPGFIDAHTHAWADALEQALMFGITTELDQFTDQRMAASMRAEQKAGNVASRADLFSAGTFATAPKGHGTQWSPTAVPMQPANLSSKKELHFQAKGDGKPFRVMVFAQNKGMMPMTQTFVAGRSVGGRVLVSGG